MEEKTSILQFPISKSVQEQLLFPNLLIYYQILDLPEKLLRTYFFSTVFIFFLFLSLILFFLYVITRSLVLLWIFSAFSFVSLCLYVCVRCSNGLKTIEWVHTRGRIRLMKIVCVCTVLLLHLTTLGFAIYWGFQCAALNQLLQMEAHSFQEVWGDSWAHWKNQFYCETAQNGKVCFCDYV